MGAAINHFLDQFNKFKSLPSGAPFSISVTDAEATAAAQEYVSENKTLIRQLIQRSAGVGLDVEKPEIWFRNNGITLSAKGGRGLLKVGASLDADVQWNGRLNVHVNSVNVPFVSISPEKLNSVVEKPLEEVMRTVEDYAVIRSFSLKNGLAILEAVRK